MSAISIFENLKQASLQTSDFSSYEQRFKRLKLLKQYLNEQEDGLFEALDKDLGKSAFDSYLTEIALLHEELDYFLKNLRKCMSPRRVGSPLAMFPARSEIHYRPLGSVLIISPWNYPVQLLFSPLIGALGAGNNVLLKPSEVASNVSSFVAKTIPQYFDDTEVAVVEGGVEETSLLLSLPFDHIFFTGSTNIGKIVMRKAAENLTPVTLELGGKSPCLLFENQSFDTAVKRIVWGKFINAGQTCVAPDYVLLPKGKRSEFIKHAKKWIEHFYGPDPASSPDYTHIISSKHFERLSSLVDGEELELSYPSDPQKLCLGPVLLKASSSSKVMNDEIFGPILPLIEVDSFEEAITFVTKRGHPLAAYLFTSDKDKELAFLERIQSGGVCLNDTLVHLSNNKLPFGGVGPSGMGSYHGKKSFEIFSHERSVMKRSFWFENSLRYPPALNKLSWLKKLLPWVS